ncbi:MAG: peptidoglycan-binding domain-containing protein [Candidatus Paceibacterota bacterium]
MIKKLKIGLLIAVLSLAVVAGSAFAAAGDLTWSVDQTIDLSSPDINVTIASGSTASSIVINAGTIVPTLASGDVFTLSTVAVGDFAVSPTTGVIITCNSNTTSRVVITATGSQAYTITPSATACAYSAGSGGGGSSGDTTPPTDTSISISAGATSTATLAVALTLGATGATNMIISNDAGFAGASWETYATSRAWTLTSGDGVKTVYAKFKDAAGNISAAISDTITVSGTGTTQTTSTTSVEGCSAGNMYSTTTGALCVSTTTTSSVIAGCGTRTSGYSTTTGQSCVGNAVSTTARIYNFGSTTLKYGSRGEAVKELQRFLNDTLHLGLVVDGILGSKTIAVIKVWQKNHGLVVDGLVGPATKAKMNASVQ